jgi:hypothetical protein
MTAGFFCVGAGEGTEGLTSSSVAWNRCALQESIVSRWIAPENQWPPFFAPSAQGTIRAVAVFVVKILVLVHVIFGAASRERLLGLDRAVTTMDMD